MLEGYLPSPYTPPQIYPYGGGCIQIRVRPLGKLWNTYGGGRMCNLANSNERVQ